MKAKLVQWGIETLGGQTILVSPVGRIFRIQERINDMWMNPIDGLKVHQNIAMACSNMNAMIECPDSDPPVE